MTSILSPSRWYPSILAGLLDDMPDLGATRTSVLMLRMAPEPHVDHSRVPVSKRSLRK